MERKIETHVLKSFRGRTFGYAATPDRGSPYDPLVKSVRAAVQALVTLDQHIEQGAPDAAHIALAVALRKARLHTASEAEELAAQRHAFYAPPAVTDPALDAELRAYVRGLPFDAQQKLMVEVGKGKRSEVLHALARFPAPDPLAETARGLLKAHREVADPEGAQALVDRDAALEWAESTTAAVENVINDATTAGTLSAGVVV